MSLGQRHLAIAPCRPRTTERRAVATAPLIFRLRRAPVRQLGGIARVLKTRRMHGHDFSGRTGAGRRRNSMWLVARSGHTSGAACNHLSKHLVSCEFLGNSLGSTQGFAGMWARTIAAM